MALLFQSMRKSIASLVLLFASAALFASETGLASWYTADRPDALTANGEIFDNSALTAAHKSLKFGTIVRVTDNESGESIEVRINDRGPYVENRIIDLTPEGARLLGFYDKGLAEVTVEVVSEPEVEESEYIDGSRTGWYTLQVGTYTNTRNAYEVYRNIKSTGLRTQTEIIDGPMLRLSVPDIQAYRLEDVKARLASVGITEPLVKGARNPYQ